MKNEDVGVINIKNNNPTQLIYPYQSNITIKTNIKYELMCFNSKESNSIYNQTSNSNKYWIFQVNF